MASTCFCNAAIVKVDERRPLWFEIVPYSRNLYSFTTKRFVIPSTVNDDDEYIPRLTDERGCQDKQEPKRENNVRGSAKTDRDEIQRNMRELQEKTPIG